MNFSYEEYRIQYKIQDWRVEKQKKAFFCIYIRNVSSFLKSGDSSLDNINKQFCKKRQIRALRKFSIRVYTSAKSFLLWGKRNSHMIESKGWACWKNDKFFPGSYATGEHWRPCCQAKDGGCRPHLVELPCQGALVPPQLNSSNHYFTSVYFTTIHLTYKWSLPHCHLLRTSLGLSLCSLQTVEMQDFSSVISTNVGQLRWKWHAGKKCHSCSVSNCFGWLACKNCWDQAPHLFFFFLF